MEFSRYTFAELLRVFCHLQLPLQTGHKEIAKAIGISATTFGNWWNGNYTPRSQADVLRLARFLGVTPLQADLLLYAVDITWIKYGTPIALLHSTDVLRFREAPSPIVFSNQPLPSIAEIETTWATVFEDEFTSNFNRWGLGTKDANIARVTRSIESNHFLLKVENRYHDTVLFGGDSACLAPANYYFCVTAQNLVDGTDDGYGLLFNEIGDDCTSVFRIRESSQTFSVVSTQTGAEDWQVHLRRIPCPTLRPREQNTLAILALGNQHWFYINQHLAGFTVINRPSHSRLDVACICDLPGQTAQCAFTRFCVKTPKIEPLIRNLA